MAQTARIISLPTGSVLVQFEGELDLADVPFLGAQIVDALRISADVVVDLRAVTFLDAAVIGTLVAAHRRARADGGGVVLAGPSPRVEKVLRLGQAVPTVPTASAASMPPLPRSLPGEPAGDEPPPLVWSR